LENMVKRNSDKVAVTQPPVVEVTRAPQTPDAKTVPEAKVGSPISGVRSPTHKRVKGEDKEEKNNKECDVWKLITIKGGSIFVVYLNSKNCSQSDGFAPYTFGLGQHADGEYKKYDQSGKLLKEFECDTLLTMGCVGSYVRRGSGGMYGNSLVNKQMGKGGQAYGRKVLAFFAQENVNELNAAARQKHKFKVLYEILVLTNKLNKKMNPGNKGNKYRICLEDDPPIEKQKSLDAYLRDRDVVNIMQSYCLQLDEFWVKKNPESAKIFFDETRKKYPEMAHSFGYMDTLSKFNDPDDVEEDGEKEDEDAYLKYV
jgi:hypothetical protein